MKRTLPLLLAGLCIAASSASVADAQMVMHAGEWQTRNDNGRTNLVCEHTDHTFDRATFTRMMSASGAVCTVGDVHTTGMATTVSASCQVAGGHMTTTDTITWRGPDSYTSHVRSHFEGGKIAIPDMDITQVAQRLGPCKPGDRQSPY